MYLLQKSENIDNELSIHNQHFNPQYAYSNCMLHYSYECNALYARFNNMTILVPT